MTKFMKTLKSSSVEGTILVILLAAVCVVLAAGWGASMKLRQTVAANAAIMNVDTSAQTEVEHLRTLADSQIQNSRAFFLMGSKSIFDKQKAEKDQFAADLASYQKKHPQVQDIVKKITDLTAQEADFFKQAEDFRSKQTESKIVGQFYQAKTSPLLTQINENLDKITALNKDAMATSKASAKQAGLDAQAEIPKGMTMLSSAIAVLSLCFALLIVRMLANKARLVRDRDRLVNEAKNAILSRDEVISAFSQDLKEPLESLRTQAASADADLINATVVEVESIMADIQDQTKSMTGGLHLRLEQLAMADILDEAQTFLQPLAKQKDITLQFDAVNQSVLAYVDRERVMRVLSNVVGNALKFSAKHSRVNVKVKSDAQFVNISVVDSGPGIPEAQLATIFESSWQARRTAEHGAGVGLAVVKTIIEAHGGIVRAERNIQGGTTVTFSLSRRRPVNAQLKKPQSSGVRKITRSIGTAEFTDGPSV